MDAILETSFRSNLRDKLIAFAIHIGASLPIYIALFLGIRFIWYPDFYYDVLEVQPILVMLFLVDVVLGPLLTFVVYKKAKPRLKFDIGVIVAFQLGAFFYGVSVVYKERPLYLVYAIDRFVVVTANSIDTDYIVYPELKINLPQVVATGLPEEQKENELIMFDSLKGGPDIEHLPSLYRPLQNAEKLLIQHGIRLTELPIDVMKKVNEQWPGLANIDVKGYPIIPTKTNDQLLIWNEKDQAVIGLIDQNPWVLMKHK